MTLDEAIQHCRDQAWKQRAEADKYTKNYLLYAAKGCEECAAEHEQLAEWLEELRHQRKKLLAQTRLIMELEQRREQEVNRAAILRLCNEIEDAVTSIDKMNPSQNAWYELCFIRDKLKAIGKELTGDAGTD